MLAAKANAIYSFLFVWFVCCQLLCVALLLFQLVQFVISWVFPYQTGVLDSYGLEMIFLGIFFEYHGCQCSQKPGNVREFLTPPQKIIFLHFSLGEPQKQSKNLVSDAFQRFKTQIFLQPWWETWKSRGKPMPSVIYTDNHAINSLGLLDYLVAYFPLSTTGSLLFITRKPLQ